MKPCTLALCGALLLVAGPCWAVDPIGYTASDGVNAVAVTGATPLPVAETTGGAPVSSINPLPVLGAATTVTTTVTRPADTNAYAANDAWADSTSAPVSGGFTLAAAARAASGSGIITDLVVVSSNDPATPLQGEVWVFDGAVTAVNDNAAFSLSDADAVKLVGVIPFTLVTTTGGGGTNSYAEVQNLSLGFTAVGSANLRFLMKVKNAYVPVSAEALTIRVKIVQAN
jgi:hypothetical protein